ncbi:MAG: PH domain-containing protein [Chloroflexota bacterium]
MMATNIGPEKPLGIWHESKANLPFWLKTIFTLSIYYFAVYKHNEIRLTTRRLTQRRGNLFTTNDTSMSIENITDVDVNMSLLGRMFNYGDISIQTPGSGGAEIQATRLSNPDKLREAIFDLRDGKLDEVKL